MFYSAITLIKKIMSVYKERSGHLLEMLVYIITVKFDILFKYDEQNHFMHTFYCKLMHFCHCVS
jgi:hypothetical protein